MNVAIHTRLRTVANLIADSNIRGRSKKPLWEAKHLLVYIPIKENPAKESKTNKQKKNND